MDDPRMDQETKDELELAEASSGSEDEWIFREVIVQATRAIRKQLLSDTDDSEAAELGNGYDF
jgi:hypothetical protein